MITINLIISMVKIIKLFFEAISVVLIGLFLHILFLFPSIFFDIAGLFFNIEEK